MRLTQGIEIFKKKVFTNPFFWIISLFFVVFGSVIFGGKTLYPLTPDRSIQFNQSVADLNSSQFRPIYLDHGASDWIEVPYNQSGFFSIKNREAPLWNPYNALGSPLIHNISGGTTNPFTFWLNFYNTERAWNMLYIFRLLVSVIFTFLFLQKLSLNKFSSTIGAFLYGFSGYATLHLNMFHFSVDAVIPFLMWGLISFMQNQNTKYFVFLTMAIITMILGGNPQNLILGMALATFFAFFQKNPTKREYWKFWKYYLCSIGLALGATLFVTIPFYELFSQSLKYHENVGIFALPIQSLLGLIVPVFHIQPGWGFNYLPYLGIFPMVIIVSSLNFRPFRKKHKTHLFFLLFSILFCLKVIGFPLINWVGIFPILDNILFTKYVSVLFFSLSVVFAQTINILCGKELVAQKKIFLVFLTLFLSLNFIFFYYWTRAGFLFDRFFCMTYLGVLLFLIFVYWARKFFAKQNLGIILGVLAMIEILFLNLWFKKDLSSVGIPFKQPYFVTEIKKDQTNTYDRVFGVGRVLMGNLSALYQLHDIRGLTATNQVNYFNFMKEFVLDNKLDLHPFTTTSTIFSEKSLPFLNLLGVKYIVFDDCEKHSMDNLEVFLQEGCMTVLKNKLAFDRSFMIYDVISTDSRETAFEKLKDPAINLRKTAVIVSPLSLENKGNLELENPLNFSVKIKDYGFNKVRIAVETTASGLLVLSDLDFPGWGVTVDGESSEIINTNYILRGVFVPKGSHEVIFQYKPRSVFWGGGISLLVFCLLCGIYKTKKLNML